MIIHKRNFWLKCNLRQFPISIHMNMYRLMSV